MKGSDQLRA